MNNMTIPKAISLVLPVLAVACGNPYSDPTEVARLYWESMAAGDVEVARQYATPETAGSIREADEDFEVEQIQLMVAEVDGDEGVVETAIDLNTEDRQLNLEFETAVVRIDGRWLVDVDATNAKLAANVVQQVIGESMSQMGESLGDALGGMMEGMMEGLAEGFREMGESFEQGEEPETRPDDPKLRR